MDIEIKHRIERFSMESGNQNSSEVIDFVDKNIDTFKKMSEILSAYNTTFEYLLEGRGRSKVLTSDELLLLSIHDEYQRKKINFPEK